MTAAAKPSRSGRHVRVLGGVLILAVIVWRLGTGPFVRGLGDVTPASVGAAVAIGIVCTTCCAWRWSLVAHGLGVGVPMPAAVAAYYRSQFLNTVLPGGVLGDVHRGVQHGREVGDVSHGVRAVVWERFAGQVVQVALALIVLTVLPSPVRASMPIVALAVVIGALGVVALVRALPDRSRAVRAARAARADISAGLLDPRVWPSIAFASVVVVGCHAATFLVAAHAAGSALSTSRMLPLAAVLLLAMTLPTNVGGWGPREGAAAWLFASAGLGAAQGVAIATVFGVLVFAACLPGVAVLLFTWLRQVGQRPVLASPVRVGAPVRRPAGA